MQDLIAPNETTIIFITSTFLIPEKFLDDFIVCEDFVNNQIVVDLIPVEDKN